MPPRPSRLTPLKLRFFGKYSCRHIPVGTFLVSQLMCLEGYKPTYWGRKCSCFTWYPQLRPICNILAAAACKRGNNSQNCLPCLFSHKLLLSSSRYPVFISIIRKRRMSAFRKNIYLIFWDVYVAARCLHMRRTWNCVLTKICTKSHFWWPCEPAIVFRKL